MSVVAPSANRATQRERWKGWTADRPPAEIRDFVRWYCLDRKRGETFYDYARKSGQKVTVLRRWMADRRVNQYMDAELRAVNASPGRVQDVIDMLYHRATSADDVQAAKLYLQHVDRLVTRTQVDVVLHDARQLSDQDLAHELQRALALLHKREDESTVEDAEVIEDSRPPALTT